MAPGRSIAGRSLYLCTPDRADLEEFLREVIDGGVDVVQLRDKHLDARALLTRAEIVRRVCAETGVPFIMNDRPDLALAAGADGVHVGQDDVEPELCRQILGASSIVGLSTHHRDELTGALYSPVDYFAVGPVVETPTKPGRAGTGIAYVTAAARAAEEAAADGAPLPFFVTGGVTPERIEPLVTAGARGFVVVRYLTEASEPGKAARLLRNAIDDALALAVRSPRLA